MPDFRKRRQLARFLDRSAERFADFEAPEQGWISTMRHALGMSAGHVAARKGVSRNAVYQAERSEKDGAVSLKQMDRLARAMGGTFVYAIVPNEPIATLKYNQAVKNARELAALEPEFATWSEDDQADWIDDTIAEQLEDHKPDFWGADSKGS
ncbi:MAG: transcriptional regulator [Thalassovita sp.]